MGVPKKRTIRMPFVCQDTSSWVKAPEGPLRLGRPCVSRWLPRQQAQGSQWFFMLVGQIDSICDRKTKTMLMIIIKAFQCHRGGDRGQRRKLV